MLRRILPQIRLGESEQGRRRFKPVLLQMDKSAGQLNQSLVKIAVKPRPVRQPQFFQNIMRLVKKLPVETLEITEIMSIQFLPAKLLNQLCNLPALFAHTNKVSRAPAIEKPNLCSLPIMLH